MADYQAGKRYAQAAFAIARDSGEIDAWRGYVDDIATVLTESGLAAGLADQRTPLDRRLAIIDRALDLPPLPANLARLMVSKGRTKEARAMAQAFNRMADEANGIEHAEIKTAVPLTPEQVTAIERQIGDALGKDVRATASVDPSVIGGVVMRVGDRLIDGSVKTRLRLLRQELAGVR